MRPAVDLENVIVEILHPQAEPRNADFPNDFKLMIGQRSRLTFESDFVRFIPGQNGLHLARQIQEL